MTFAPGRTAEIKESDFRFQRQQSLMQRGQEWAKREPPVESWGKSIANGIGWAVVMAAIVLVTSWVR